MFQNITSTTLLRLLSFKVIQHLLQARTAISSFKLLLRVPVRQNANKY